MAFTPIDEEEIIDEPVAEEAKPRFIPIEDDEFFGIGGEEEPPEPVVAPEAAEPVEAPKSRFTPISEEEFFGLPEPTEPIPVTGEEGLLRQAADIPLKIGESINNSIKGITDLFGADNAISQNLSQNADWYRSLLSAQALEDEQEVGRILKEAEDGGVIGQLGAGLEALSVAPVDFVASGVGSLAVFAATGLAGRAAAVAGAARAGLTGKAAIKAVETGVKATQIATGAAMGAGIVKGEIYQSVKDEMLAQGKTEEEAKSVAMDAQSYGGKNLDQILIGAGLGALGGATGAEKIIGKVLAKGGLEANAGRVANILKNGFTEAVPEFFQAAQEKVASNLALQREGVDVPITRGVFSQGALEGLVGLGLGVGAGAIEPRLQTEPTKEEVSAAAAETQDVARRSMDVAPATASLVEGEAEQIVQSQAETPEQRVARLQREAQEAAGIELEEEPPVSGLPPVEPTPIVTPPTGTAPTPEIAQAAQSRITEREGQAVTPVEEPAGNRVEAAAYQAPDGTVYFAADHLGAMAKARDAGKIEQAEIDAKQETASRETPEFGFATNAEPFVSRDQAEAIASQSGQITVEQPATGKLHSNEVSLDAFAQPETAEAGPTPPVAEEAQPITATRTVADSIRDKDTFIYNGQRGAVSVEDNVTVFRPFGTQEKFEIPINPNQKIGEIEGIEWARKGQARTTPVEPKPENASIIESKPPITTEEIDQAEPDFDVPPALIEIEKSQTLNDLADLFDTGESKVVQEGNRARRVAETPEFYRQVTPQQIGLAQRLVDNALRIIDALPVSDQQKQDMAEPYLLLDQDITNYESNPEYQQYKASIRAEVRPAGEAGVLPETETEVAAGVRELEQRAKAEAERLEREATARRVAAGQAVFIPTTEGAPPTAVEPTTAEARFSQFAQPKERPDLAELPDFKSFEMDVRGVPVRFDIDSTKSNENTLYLESFRVPREERRQGVGREAMTSLIKWANENNVTLKGEALTAPADRQYRTPQEMREQGYMNPRELFNFYKTLGWEADPEGPTKTMGIPMVYRPKPIAEIKRTQDQYGVTEEEATSIVENKPFKVVTSREGALPSGWFYETYGGQAYAIPQTVVENRLAAQGELRRLSRLERAALSGLLTEQRLVNETDAKSYINDAKSQGFTDDDIAAATTEAQAKWNERFGDNGNARQVAGDVPPPVVNFAAEEAKRATKPKVTGGSALPSSKLFGMTAREALQYLADQNLGASDMEREGRPLNLSQLMQRAASILAKTPLRILDADFIKKAKGGKRAYRSFRGYVRLPATFKDSITQKVKPYFESPETLVHEIGHTLTADAIKKYVDDLAPYDANGADYLNALDKALANQNTPEPVKRLINLYKQTIDELGITKQYFGAGGLAGIDATRSQKKANDRKIPIINKFTGKKIGWYEFYGLANLHEFVTMTWSDKPFQDMLKNIKVKNQPSIFDKFVSIVRDLFGFDSDTMAAAVIDASYALAQLETPSRGGTVEERIAATTAARGAAPEAEDIVPLAPTEEYAPRTDEEQEAFDKASTNKILRRNPQLAVAAVRMKNGEITAGEYADLVDILDPFVVKGAEPVPTNEKIYQYMSQTAGGKPTSEQGKEKLAKIGAFKEDGTQRIPNGKLAEFRIDIPTYNESTKNGDTIYSITGHEPVSETAKQVGKTIAHLGIAKITNPQFITRTISGKGDAIQIAMGAGKFPLATVKGNYEAITELPADINDPNVWTEAGYNPVRSSELVDVRSKQAVRGGSEAIMVGSRVFVKNAQMEARPTGVTMGEVYAPLPEPTGVPTFAKESPEANTLSNMKASMEKVDAASEAKGGKPETQKVSEIAANWMESGGDERALQDAIVENTNLTPANAARVAKAIAKQYGLQQQIAETGAVIAEITPEPEGAPRKSAVTKLIEQTTGVRKPVVKLQVSESAALKKQIQLKAREARETRKARKEAAEDLAKAITDYVKANPIRGPINSRQAMSITKKALKLDVNNEAAVDRFEMYVERVIENANYDRDLTDARALIKRAKTFAKSKDTQGNVKTTLDAIANISPTLLDNPFEFNLVVQRYLLGLAPVTAKQYAVMPDADVRRYLESLETQIKDNQETLDRAKAQRILDKQAAYAEEKGIPLDEAIAILNSEEFLQEKTIEKLEDLTKLLTAMAQESQKDVKAYDDSGATPKQKELISFMRKVNLDSLINEEKKRYIRFANNLLANGATFGMEQFQSIALGQEAAMKAAKDKRLSNKLAAWISPIGGDKAIDTARRIAAKTQSEADTFKNIFGREAVGAFRNILGLNRLDVAQTDSNRAKEQIANEFGEYFKGLRKKYGDDATGFEAKGYAGIAGYLIQTDGNKTEAESIPYRRRLMEQNIAELRKSDKQADLAEADLKERALAQLTGATNAEILSQLQALNPASYEQLMWVKDVMLPKWRDLLKEHDENFRNQANNYNNPDHLTITYKFPEGQLLPSEMEDVYQQDMIGMRIKQAANSIKRKDHPNLPVSKSGTIANIDINFGYNQYNALVDQVDKAFVAPAWEQVVAFTKTPEFEQVMGGRANALFVKNLLRDIQTSRSRQSITDDEAQLIAGGVRLARKISTQAVLGGFTQPLRQIPDQLSKLFFTTGRFDLITKNLLTTAQAAPLLNKFPISRRGDAQAGTQYASQFSELARKVEASVTDRKWAQYRELMNKVGEFWMTPLRGSDVWAAKVSWMSYYEAELNKKGIKMESWGREAELVDTDQDRKEAAAYAEFAVDFYGGASDPTKMASLSKQTNNGWKEFAKLLFLPLNSFALQQKNSLISDLRDAYLRTGDRKASIAAIAGTLAGMAAFHGMRIYIIGGLLYPAGKALLMGIFGIDMDEPDEEEKQKQLEDNWRKFKASMYGNIVAGGLGEFVEKNAIDAVNRTAYLWDANINPDSLLNDKGEIMSFRQYEKEVSPLYRFRSYGSSEYSFGLADVLTEQATHALAETQQLMTPEEMERYTGNEQAYAAFATGVEWMYFFRLMDTDVKRIATDLKRQMDKEVKEREAEIRAIRSGR